MVSGKKVKLSADNILSISAIIIAVSSIVISVWQGLETKKHNRLSVRPNLEIYFTRGSENTGFLLINTGLGPAMIKDNVIWCDGKERREITVNDLPELLGMPEVIMSYGPSSGGVTLQAGERRDLVMFRNESLDKITFPWEKISERVSFRVKYESMYGEKFEINSLESDK